jgi:DnaA family protein
VAEQLIFELAQAEPATFANFVTGANGEVVALLRRFAGADVAETALVLWGAEGSGKSHLLQAVVAAAQARGGASLYCASPAAVPEPATVVSSLVAVDAVDTADAAAQGRLFTLFNLLAARGGHLLTAASVPPARLPLREDLRTRLGWGLTYEILPLADADKGAALEAYARERGFALPRDVIDHLLAHGRRDMATLVAALAALDRYALATKRPITVALAREWLRQGPPP